MITGSTALKYEYETTRTMRYDGFRQDVFYAPGELQAAYEAWATTYSGKRDLEWDDYTDVRDCVPRGTNNEIRKRRAVARFH